MGRRKGKFFEITDETTTSPSMTNAGTESKRVHSRGAELRPKGRLLLLCFALLLLCF